MLYHLVIEGGAVIELLDGHSTELKPGDVVVFPHGDAHHMSSGHGAKRPFPNYGINAKIEAATYSARANTDTSWTVEGSGDTLTLVGSPRKDQHGTFTPKLQVKRP